MSNATHTVYQTGLAARNSIGNALSPYWFARSLAWLAGYDYQMVRVQPPFKAKDWFTSKHFMRYLPTFVARNSCGDLEGLKRACRNAHGYTLISPHMSTTGWPQMWPTVQADMQSSFALWANASNFVPHKFQPGDVVIQDRCAVDTLLYHPSYGPPAFRFYSGLKGTKAKNIYVLYEKSGGKNKKPFYPCLVLHVALCSHLSTLAPKAKVHSYDAGSLSDTWAHMLYAPVFYKGVSTFGLWSGMGNPGAVYSTPLFVEKGRGFNGTPDMGPHWHWVHTPVLTPSVAAKLSKAKMTNADVDRILTWLMHA